MFTPSDDLGYAVENSKITFISVGTPSLEDGSIDLSYVRQASAAIGSALSKKWHLIVIRSTVTPTTCDTIVRPEVEKTSGLQCGPEWGLCMNPEFLREGSAVHDSLYPDRVIIGESDARAGATLARLYRSFLGRKVTIKRMSMVNAELVKYANNAFLAMKISFANMMANLCEPLPSADIRIVTQAIGLDKRIGSAFLNAGLGYGGSCFPKDLKALIAFGNKLNVNLALLQATAQINEAQPLQAVRLGQRLIGPLSGKRIAILGLAFKPNTDDIREATSIRLIRALLQRHAEVVVYDPKAIPHAQSIFEDSIAYAPSAMECVRGSDLCILATEWESFKELRPGDFVRLMEKPAVVDGRRILNPARYANLRFAAVGLGSRSEN
jgi:UDPglucose 6-dehydrogenase